ncbi:hypothetical protein V1287_001112 [Bradyrhizobium sp. AZCC 1699]
MRSMKIVHQEKSSALADGVDQSGPGRILLGVFETLDRAEIPYCVLHGYERYPQRITSDVDCMISASVHPGQLAALFHESRGISIDADLVCFREYYFVLAGRNADLSPSYLVLDLSIDYELGGLRFYNGREVIESRRRHSRFWIPAPPVEFGCYLVRKIAKAQLNDTQGRRLSTVYAQDPTGCQQHAARFWGARNTALIVSAASSGDWTPVRRCLSWLGAEMRMRAMLREPRRSIGNWSRRMGHQIRSGLWPEGGLSVIFLGPDGAGKSSVIKLCASRFGRCLRSNDVPLLCAWLTQSVPPPLGPNSTTRCSSAIAHDIGHAGAVLLAGVLPRLLPSGDSFCVGTLYPRLARPPSRRCSRGSQALSLWRPDLVAAPDLAFHSQT